MDFCSGVDIGRKGRPRIVHTYLPEAVYEGLREAAFKERVHDIVLEGIESALRKRGRKR